MEPLYSKILAAQWNELHPSVRQLHSYSRAIFSARGEFNIFQGRKVLARFLAFLLRMPKSNERGQVSLRIIQNERSEVWTRIIDGRVFESAQYFKKPDVLSERVGPLEIRFHLKADRGCLVYLYQATFFRILKKSIPLPKWISPKIRASECPAPDGLACKIKVEISFPLVGTLLRYSGLLLRESL